MSDEMSVSIPARTSDSLRRLVEIHNRTKAISLQAEEMGCGKFQTLLQPVREMRDSHVHLMQALGMGFGFGKDTSPEAQFHAVKAALKHEIRAFYDAADWLSLLLRQDIRETLEKYSSEAIRAALPAYFSHHRPTISKINKAIAENRERKNGSDADLDGDDADLYDASLATLRTIHEEVLAASASLEEYHGKEEMASRHAGKRSLKISVLGGLIVALLVALAACGGRYIFPASPQQHTSATSPNTR